VRGRKYSRRDVLKAASGLVTSAVFAQPLKAAAPTPIPVTAALIDAARKEAKVSFYTALELTTSERLARAFEAKYPGIAVRVERSGAERNFQRIAQEQGSGIRAVDVVCSTDPAHFIDWKRNDWVAAFVPEDVAKHFPPEHVHPSYSGAILTTTFLLARDLGWSYFEKLAQQQVMQVQSAAEPPKKIMVGERAIMADGNDYNLVLFKDQGQPVEIVYAAEGSKLITVPCGVFKSAPNPNAARLLQSFLFSAEAQQIFIDGFAHRSFHALVKEKPGRTPLSAVKLLKADPVAVLAQTEEIKARYAKIFGV